MTNDHETTDEATANLHALLNEARDALCGCDDHHGTPETDSEWAAVPIQCGTIIHHALARMLNYWYETRPCDIDDYLEAGAFGIAKAGPGENGAHFALSILRMMAHWFDRANPIDDYWGDITPQHRHEFVHALAEAADTITQSVEWEAKEPNDDDGWPPAQVVVGRFRAAASALGVGGTNIGLDHMSEADQAYIEASTLAGVIHGRLASGSAFLGSSVSENAIGVGQQSYAVAAVGATRESGDVESDYVAASTALGLSMPIARWFKDHADTMPRAGAVWRLKVAASMLADADTVADGKREGYADRIKVETHDERELVARALEHMREAVASIELETR